MRPEASLRILIFYFRRNEKPLSSFELSTLALSDDQICMLKYNFGCSVGMSGLETGAGLVLQ